MDSELKSTPKKIRNRKDVALHLVDYEQCLENQSSQRDAADVIGISRGTLRYWKTRKDSIPLSASAVKFFESPDGAEFLHTFTTAAQLVMSNMGGCGIRLVSLFLDLTGLNHFVGSSYETLRRREIELENHIVAFGDEERSRLSAAMPKKKISVAQDETFHPKTCLVAIEPVSDFILLEQYSEKRDAESWNTTMDVALTGLNIEVIQSTSDEAKGILSHVEKNLGAHHSPDIFHVQYDISKACSAALSSKTRQAEKTVEKICENIQTLKQHEESPLTKKGRKPDVLNQSVSELEARKISAAARAKQCKENEEKVSSSKKSISAEYHPYNLKTGEAKDEKQLEKSLNENFNTIENIVQENNLRESAIKKIEKAKRVTPGLIKTFKFYWLMIHILLESLSLTKPLELLMREILIPAEYLLMASKKGQDKLQRKEIFDSATELINKLETIPEWQQLDNKETNRLRQAAKEGAGYFQRSSSCVEGRNGYLSLRHHGLHQLSNRKLGSLTVIHNYFIKRADGTTAAERFFENKPRDLFEYLLKKMPYPGRSGQRAKLLKKAA